MQVLTADFTEPDLAQVLAHSLHDTGFALLAGAPVDHAALDRLYAEWALFFAGEEKYDAPSDPDLPDGYLPYRTRDGRLIDLKESFYFHLGGDCPEHLRETTAAVYRNLLDIANALLRALAAYQRPEIPAPVRRALENSRGAVLRVLHYPPLTAFPEMGDDFAPVEESVRLGAHQDLNLLTILPAATMPGLDIMDRQGEWHRVSGGPGTVVVNSGDELQHLSRGYYRSTKHRVRNHAPELLHPRYAAAMFLAAR
jgi:isopenicillin N synthase-like dioxygenase